MGEFLVFELGKNGDFAVQSWRSGQRTKHKGNLVRPGKVNDVVAISKDMGKSFLLAIVFEGI